VSLPSPPPRRGTKRVHTESIEASHIASERYRAADRTPNGVHGRGGRTDKCRTSIDGGRIPGAGVDGFAIHSDA
jgi:hypothetical protein